MAQGAAGIPFLDSERQAGIIVIMNDSKKRPLDPVIEFYKKDLDMSLISENLKLTHEERFKKFIAIHDAMVRARGLARQKKADD